MKRFSLAFGLFVLLCLNKPETEAGKTVTNRIILKILQGLIELSLNNRNYFNVKPLSTPTATQWDEGPYTFYQVTGNYQSTNAGVVTQLQCNAKFKAFHGSYFPRLVNNLCDQNNN